MRLSMQDTDHDSLMLRLSVTVTLDGETPAGVGAADEEGGFVEVWAGARWGTAAPPQWNDDGTAATERRYGTVEIRLSEGAHDVAKAVYARIRAAELPPAPSAA